MTKTVDNFHRYNEHFPITNKTSEERYSPITSRRRSSCPASPTPGKNPLSIISETNLPKASHRRHSAGQCLLTLPKSPLNTKKMHCNILISSACDSRRSSGSNGIPEVITECDSDEEYEDNNKSIDNDAGFDYIRCINCSRSNNINKSKSTSELHIHQQIINYCYNCRHLNSNPHLPAFYEGRRSSWTAGESLGPVNSPRNSRRSSLVTSNSCTELPIISEPSFDDETNDTAELKLKVEQEVVKLTKLNNRKNKQQTEQNDLNTQKHKKH